MIHSEAISTAANAATRFGKPFVVWRMPAWPADVYGVIAIDRDLPKEAEKFETLEPAFGTRPAKLIIKPRDQGSLF